MYWRNLNIFFSRTTKPVSTKLIFGWRGFKWRAPNFPKGEIITKLQNLKIIFSRTTWIISTKLKTMHSWVKGIQVCWNDDSFYSHKNMAHWPLVWARVPQFFNSHTIQYLITIMLINVMSTLLQFLSFKFSWINLS